MKRGKIAFCQAAVSHRERVAAVSHRGLIFFEVTVTKAKAKLFAKAWG